MINDILPDKIFDKWSKKKFDMQKYWNEFKLKHIRCILLLTMIILIDHILRLLFNDVSKKILQNVRIIAKTHFWLINIGFYINV